MPFFDNNGYSFNPSLFNFSNIIPNLRNGYQFGDLSLGLMGFRTKDPVANLNSAKVAQEVKDAEIADERNFSQDQINSARAWSEYMDSTAVQRRVKDIEAAGLNPWLALGSISPGNVSVSDTGSSAGSSNRSTSNSNSSSAVSAAMIMALGKLAYKLL